MLGEVVYDRFHSLGNVHFMRFDVNLRLLWSLVWCGDSGELYPPPLVREEEAQEMNVNTPLISPALAFLYRPFGSRCSTTSSGASTKTSTNPSPALSWISRAIARSVRYGEIKAVMATQEASAKSFDTFYGLVEKI
jgi:hypothetical protein